MKTEFAPDPEKVDDWTAEEVIAYADTFTLAFRAISNSSLEINTANYVDKHLMGTPIVPAIIILAFAIELYLKAILKKQGCDKKIIKNAKHNIYQLWSLLDDKNHDYLHSAMPGKQTQFDYIFRNLCIHKGVFENWRYGYEFKNLSVNIDFIIELADAARYVAYQEISGITNSQKNIQAMVNKIKNAERLSDVDP